MDFESPDVEKDFPGLYASESGKRSQESDFSDDTHERPSKKDLLIGKRKEKKESKKDQGYAALEGESSPEEDIDVKSPSKSKKTKSFKFPIIKEKREKSREKEVKEKDKEKEKDADKEKDKKKELKSKLKLKDRKKVKHGEESVELGDEMPVFGVPLSVAVERSRCHDGVDIPLVVRDCIDYIEENGLTVENIYRMSGVKSKVQQLRKNYNQREHVNLAEYDLPTVTSLFKTFLRELPEPLLTTDLISKFEELAAKEQNVETMIPHLPAWNYTCLGWVVKHLDSVISHERQNKMNMNVIASTFGPILQMSQKLTCVLLNYCRAYFPDVELTKYVPPLNITSALPDTKAAISVELTKQDSLLNQIHFEMNHGFTTKRREEQLWEVQRLMTQLKRKLRSLEKAQDANQAPQDESSSSAVNRETVSPLKEPALDFRPQIAAVDIKTVKENSTNETEQATVNDTPVSASNPVNSVDSVDASIDVIAPKTKAAEENAALNGVEDLLTFLRLTVENKELLRLQSELQSRIKNEREAVEQLNIMYKNNISQLDENIISAFLLNRDAKGTAPYVHAHSEIVMSEEEKLKVEDLQRQHSQLMQKKHNLIKQIISEHKACLNLRVEIALLQQKKGRQASV